MYCDAMFYLLTGYKSDDVVFGFCLVVMILKVLYLFLWSVIWTFLPKSQSTAVFANHLNRLNCILRKKSYYNVGTKIDSTEVFAQITEHQQEIWVGFIYNYQLKVYWLMKAGKSQFICCFFWVLFFQIWYK